MNTPDGVLNGRTRELGDHDPTLLLTKITTARYDPDATHPDWAKALEAVRADVREWLQVRYGQALTGYPVPDSSVIFHIGNGENAKTCIAEAIGAALGESATGATS